jgi:hypothetical protein
MRNKKLRLIEVLTIQITILFKSTLSAKMYKMECLDYCKKIYTVKVKSKQRFRNPYIRNYCFIMVLSLAIKICSNH